MGVRGHWEITANLHRRPERIFTASVFTAMIDIDCVLEMQEDKPLRPFRRSAILLCGDVVKSVEK